MYSPQKRERRRPTPIPLVSFPLLVSIPSPLFPYILFLLIIGRPFHPTTSLCSPFSNPRPRPLTRNKLQQRPHLALPAFKLLEEVRVRRRADPRTFDPRTLSVRRRRERDEVHHRGRFWPRFGFAF